MPWVAGNVGLTIAADSRHETFSSDEGPNSSLTNNSLIICPTGSLDVPDGNGDEVSAASSSSAAQNNPPSTMNGLAVHCSTPVIHCSVVVDLQSSAWSGQYEGDGSDEADVHEDADTGDQMGDGMISLSLYPQ